MDDEKFILAIFSYGKMATLEKPTLTNGININIMVCFYHMKTIKLLSHP